MSKPHKPVFKTLSEQKTSPRFEAKEKRPFAKSPRPSAPRTPSEPRELSLNKAGRSGQVKVTIKGTADAPKVKKTGPLSPRAPEKIKKNRETEMKVYGAAACLALFAKRPQAIVRLWATVAMSHKIGEILSYLANNKKTYHIVDSEELAKVSGSEHHGGICMLVKKPRTLTLEGYLSVPQTQDCLLLLDGVNNAQNLGGIMRTAAFYGVKYLISTNPNALYAPAAWRVAEGGGEYVQPLQCLSPESALQALRQAGYQIVHISPNNQGTALNQFSFAPKSVIVLSEGDASDLATPEDAKVRLALSAPLENGLNVAVNAGILLSKWYF